MEECYFMFRGVVKCEWLLADTCKFNCKFCKLKDKEWKETLSLPQIEQMLDILFNKMGICFLAIYGKEIMELSDDFLLPIFDMLKYYQKKGNSYTIITNGYGVSEERLSNFKQHGLNSITVSIDILEKDIQDKKLELKAELGYKVLLMAKKLGIKDLEGIITLTHKNLPYVRGVINKLSKLGIWSSIDPIHWKNSQYCLSPQREDILEYLLQITDLYMLKELVDWIKLNRKDLLVHQSNSVLDLLKDGCALDINLKCVDEDFKEISSITVDNAGILSCCDNFFSPIISKYSIFDLESDEIWEKFKIDYLKVVDRDCGGCCWTTHFSCREAFNDTQLRNSIIHNIYD